MPSHSIRRRWRLGVPAVVMTVLALLLGMLGSPASAVGANAGTVTGVVTRADAVSAPAIKGATVRLLQPDGSLAGTTTTADDGSYSIAADPGTYRVAFDAVGYDAEFYDNATTEASAKTVTVTANTATTSINAGLVKTAGPQISGTVRNTSGVPVADVEVLLYTKTLRGDTGEFDYAPVTTTPATVTTSANGTYAFEVKPGNYIVEFSAPAYRTVYVNGSSTGTTSRDSATVIGITKGTGRDISMVMTANGGVVLSGRVVTGNDDAPVSGVDVRVEYPTSTTSGGTVFTTAVSMRTGANGTFSLTAPLAADREYIVGYYSSAFPTRYWKAPAGSTTVTTGSLTRDGADRISASTQVSRDLGSLKLVPGSGVTGVVTDRSGTPLPNVEVTPLIFKPATNTWVTATAYAAGQATVTTGSDGTYYLAISETGENKPFRLKFQTAAREVRYYPESITPDEADNIQVAPDQVLGSRNVVLPPLAKLSGKVTNNDGSGFSQGGQLVAFRKTTYREAGEYGGTAHTEFREIGRTTVSESGAFALFLPRSTFRLKYVNSTTNEEGFLPGLVGIDDAPDITLGESEALTGQQFLLPTKQFIRGTVDDTLGTPRQGVTIEARYRYVVNVVDDVPIFSSWLGPVATNAARSVTTNSEGRYALPVFSRTYRVSASATSGGRTTTAFYASGSSRIQDATDVSANGNDATGIDISLGTSDARNVQAPWISGLNKAGQVLTANVGVWSPADLTYTYLWQQNTNPANASGWATASGTSNRNTYTIPTGGGGLLGVGGSSTRYAYRVIVTAARNGTTVGQATSKATGVAVASNASPDVENRQIPYVSGPAAVGEILTGTNGQWSAAGEFSYQWFADGRVIPGATASTLTIAPDQVGRRIKFRVTETSGSSPAGGEVVESAETATVLPGVMRNLTRPSISGEPRVGAVLTADPGTWSVASPNFAYQWLINGQEVDGATAPTYTLRSEDKGKRATVRVVARSTAYTPGTATAVSTGVIADNVPQNTVAPKISGVPAVGNILTVDPGTWTPAGLTYSYQWYADGSPIPGATLSSLTLTDAQFGRSIFVIVTAVTTGYVPASAFSAIVGPVAAGAPVAVSGTPSITGRATPGNVLQVSIPAYTPADATVVVQWLRDGQPIAGATGTAYVVAASDVAHLLQAQVTYSRTGYLTTVQTSPGVVPASTPVKVAPRISVSKVVKGGKAKIVVTVTGGGALATGRVALTEGGRTYAIKVLRSGQATLVASGLRSGYHALRVKYRGSSTIKAGSKLVPVTVRS